MSEETPSVEPVPEQSEPQQPDALADQGANAVQTTVSILESAVLYRESVKQSFEMQKAEMNQLIEEQKISGQSPMSVLRSSMTPSGLAGLSAPQPVQNQPPTVHSQPLIVPNQTEEPPQVTPQPAIKQATDIVKPVEPQPVAVDPAAAALEKLVTAFYQLLVMQLDPNKRPSVEVEAAAMQDFVEGLGAFVIYEVQRQLQAMVHAGSAVEVS